MIWERKHIKVKKKWAGYYHILDAVTGLFLGEIDRHGSESGEWVVYDWDNEWICTVDTKAYAIDMLLGWLNNEESVPPTNP